MCFTDIFFYHDTSVLKKDFLGVVHDIKQFQTNGNGVKLYKSTLYWGKSLKKDLADFFSSNDSRDQIVLEIRLSCCGALESDHLFT